MRIWIVALLGIISRLSFSDTDLKLTKIEAAELDARIARFYASPSDPNPMNERVPKFGVSAGDWIHPRPWLAEPVANATHPLTRLAGEKASPRFQRSECEKVLRPHFPDLYEAYCKGKNATWMGNDRVDLFLNSWVASDKIALELDGVPTEVEAKAQVWSDDYWKTRYGLTSYRYATHPVFGSYKAAINSYAQPPEWAGALGLPLEQLAKLVIGWSPAEKYDLTVGDEGFGLTHEQKNEGFQVVGPGGDVEDWMGICHGWAAGAVMTRPPLKETVVVGARGVSVTWYPAEIKAMATLAWANGSYAANYLGSRCNSAHPATYPNGRIQDQRCFDANPAAFHLAIGNLLGQEKTAFVMDKTFDYEVWNQPVVGYDVTYFNPLNPSQRSKKWSDVSVEYDATFKGKDRFQLPLTRGRRVAGGKYDDSAVRKVVGVIATLLYLEELTPEAQPTPQPNNYARVTYTYDLEIAEESGRLLPQGGEWHQNAHPDFLWVPRKGVTAKTSYDNVDVGFTGDKIPPVTVTQVATQASRVGSPLCRVVKELLKRTADQDTYNCQ